MHLLKYIDFLGEYSDDPSSIATHSENAVCACIVGTYISPGEDD